MSNHENLDLGGLKVQPLALEPPPPDHYASSAAARKCAPKFEMPTQPLPASVAKDIILDEMVLDGRPRLNLASFVTTRMEPEAEALMQDAATKNAIDMDEYPQTTIMHQRCVNMIGRLFHAPLEPEQEATGTGAIGSSEAIMLAVLAMKWAWKAHRAKKGLPATNPNIVFGSNVQVCWHKACVYFEIEGREGKVSADKLVLTPERAEPLIDENTIGVCCLLGSTFNGEYEDIKGIHDMVVAKNEANDWMVRIHVDAASGGFVAPFLEPDLLWDFRLPNVKSINVSGHKFGLVYAGIGWLLFREKADLHPDLVFHVNYLGGDQASFTLNFSKGAGTIVGQYYQLLRLGKVGYTQIMTNAMSNAQFLRQKLVATGKVDIRDKGNIPLVAWSLKDSSKYTVFDIQDKLRDKNWIVPAYTCPPGAEELAILRVVVKQDFSRDLAETLVDDIVTAMDWLEHHPSQHAAVQGEINEKREAKHAKHTTKLKDVANRIKWAMHVVPSTSLPEDSEHGAAPLLSKHHLFSMKTDPKHRSTGEKTFGVC